MNYMHSAHEKWQVQYAVNNKKVYLIPQSEDEQASQYIWQCIGQGSYSSVSDEINYGEA